MQCLVFTVDNPALRNVALQGSSKQISTLSDAHGPHVANDGKRQWDFSVTKHGCAASNLETNPWWMVSLGEPTVVCLVKLTNRGDYYGIEHAYVHIHE